MKVILMLAFSVCFGVTFASFSITDLNFDKIKDKSKGKNSTIKNDKYSIKNFHRPTAFFSLSAGNTPYLDPDGYDFNKLLFLNGVSPSLMQVESGNQTDYINVNTSIRLKNGNSVIIYPYNYKVKADPFRRFATPTAPLPTR